tara:strand:+ start:9803 stop:15145 length:5343 start_codon:yes stop_codon:yes gene_type:complete
MAQSFNASLNVQLNPQSLNQASKQVQQALGRITGQASEFQKSLDASTARVFAFGATTAVLNGVTQSFKKLVSTTIEVEKRLIEINSIFQATDATFSRFRASIFRVAKETGQTFDTVAEGAAELARQGLSAEETAKRLKAALVMTRISGMDAEKSVKALTAAINGFTSASLTANQIVNKMVAVDTAFAVSTDDLAAAFTRAGSTAEDAGVSFDELLGLITAVEQRTARGGAVIGNAFKSIFTRLQRGTTIEKLQELGVAINASQTGIQKLQALSGAIENIADPTVVSQIKELAGGVFQINVVSAALKDLGSDTSIFANAAKTSAEAVNEAFEKNQMLSEGMASQINALVVGITNLAEKVGSITFGPLLKNLVGITTKFTEFLDEALHPERGNAFIKGFFKAIGSFLSGPALVMFTAAFLKITQLVAKFAVEGLKSLFQMGTQTEKIKQIEAGIVGLLQRDQSLRNAISSSTTTQAQKEQLILNAIRQENALLQQQANIMRSLAVMAHGRGVRGIGAGGQFRGRFNAGFRAEEAEARMLGAPAGVKARMSKGTIGGRKFIMNDHETEIPNFAGTNSAVIPHYAGGFVPNYARAGALSNADRLALNRQLGNARRRKPSPENDAEIEELERQLGLKKGQKLSQKKKKKPIKINGAGFAMLVPQLNKKSAYDADDGGTFRVGNESFPYKFTSPLAIAGPQIPKAVDKTAGNSDAHLLKKVVKNIATDGAKFADSLVPVTGAPVSPRRVMANLNKQGGGKGAMRAAVGAAFEAAIMAGLKLSPLPNKEGGDFDVKGVTGNKLTKILTLFGLSGSGVHTMDMKATANRKTSMPSMARKIAYETLPQFREMQARRGRGGRARGFIPNFAGSRGGVPMSLMRVHKDDRGSPVAVTNLRDEPNGLQDAIRRERKGMGMFAGGFIPNYHKNPMTGSADSRQANANKVTAANNKMAASADKASKGMASAGDKSLGLMSALFGVQMLMGMFESSGESELATRQRLEEENIEAIKNSQASQGEKIRAIKAEQDKTRKVKESTSSLVGLTDAIQGTISALMILQALNMFTGGGLGRITGGFMGKHFTGKGIAAGVSKRHMKARDAFLKKNPKDFIGAKAAGLRASGGAAASQTGRAGLLRGASGKALARGGALLTAGLTAAQIYSTATNDELSKNMKKQTIGRQASTGGGALAGAIAGQILIPIPILGALIGGVVGGFIGDAFGSAAFKGALAKDMKIDAGTDDIAFLGGSRDAQTYRGETGFMFEATEAAERMARGIDKDEFAMASPEERLKMMTQGITEEGQEKAKKALENFMKVHKDLGEARRKQGEESDEALELEKKMNEAQKELLQVKYLNRELEEEYGELLAKTNVALIEARKNLRESLMKGTFGKAKEALESANRDKQESDFGVELAPAMRGSLLGEQVNTMMRVEGAMRDVNQILATREDAKAELATLTALVKEGLQPEQIIGEKGVGLRDPKTLNDIIKKSGEDLKEAIKKGALDFEQIITDTALKQKENAKQINDLQIKAIEKAIGITKTREEGLVGFGDLTKDAEALAGLITNRMGEDGKVDTSRDDEIRKRLAEMEDANKFGINIPELIAEILKTQIRGEGFEIDTQEIMQGVMQSIVGASMQGLIPDDRAGAIAKGADNPRTAQEAAFKVMFDKMGEEMKSIDNLMTQQDALAEVLERTKTVYEQMVGVGEGEEGGNIGKSIQDFAGKLRDAGTSLDNFKNFNVNFNAQTKKTSDLIANVTQLNDEAIVVVQALAARVRNLETHAGRLRSDDDPLENLGEYK